MSKFVIEKDKTLGGWSIKGEDNQIVGYDHSEQGNGRSIKELVIANTALIALIEKVKEGGE